MGKINSSITIQAGEYRELDVAVQNSAGSAIDLSSVTAIDWAMASTDRSTPVLTKSYPGSGIRIDTPANGIFTVVLSGVDTRNLLPGNYYQEAAYNLGGKTINTLVGTIRLRPTII